MGQYAEFTVGNRATLNRQITNEDIMKYAELSGDFNPLHVDEEYASKSVFGRRVAHGMLTIGLVSNLLGNQLPGPGSIYLSQTIKFRSPVFPGDLIEASVEIISKEDNKKKIRLKTVCRNQDDVVVLDGEAEVLFKE